MVEVGQSGPSATRGAEHEAASLRRGAEHRRDERYAVHGDAEIFVTGGTSMFRGRILNMSASGCYVQTVAWVRPAPGTLVELAFVVKGNVVRARAEARYSESKVGLGLRFVAMEEPMRRRLDGVLAGLRKARGEKVGGGGGERSVLDALTEVVTARTDAVLQGEPTTEGIERTDIVERPAAILEAKQEVGEAAFSGLEELGLAPEGALGEADADAIAAMEEMEAAADGIGLAATGVGEGVVAEGGRDLAATGALVGERR